MLSSLLIDISIEQMEGGGGRGLCQVYKAYWSLRFRLEVRVFLTFIC